jgi:hypothetical protein
MHHILYWKICTYLSGFAKRKELEVYILSKCTVCRDQLLFEKLDTVRTKGFIEDTYR